MKEMRLRLFWVICTILLLTACSGPETPQEVSKAFWEAVTSGDADDAVEYSTLTDVEQYDGFEKEWSGFLPSWGKVVIDGNEASIEAEFAKPGDSGSERRQVVTYLVRRDERWKVDYSRTAKEVSGGIFARLFRTLDQFGNDVSEQFKGSAEDLNAEMDRMTKQFDELSDSLGQFASDSIEKHGKALRRSVEEFKDSIDQALEELDQSLSEEDKRLLNDISSDLGANREGLSSLTLDSIADSSKSIGRAQMKLSALSHEVIGKYQERWQELGKRVERDMRRMLEDISASMER